MSKSKDFKTLLHKGVEFSYREQSFEHFKLFLGNLGI